MSLTDEKGHSVQQDRNGESPDDKPAWLKNRLEWLIDQCYFSKPDWHCPWYWAPGFPVHDRNVNYDTNRHPELWTSFVTFVHRQIEELMREYGPVDILWLDGGQVRPPHQDIRMGEIAAMARRLQPGLIMADRTVGGLYEDFLTPEQTIPQVPPDQPWEACETLGRSWKYMPEDDYKSAREVIHLLIETASKGGNLLLGVGPNALGEIPARAEQVLREIGDWLRIHGEAIYGTRAVPPYEEGPVRFTRKKNVVYAFVLPTPDQQWPEQISLSAFQPRQASAVEVVGLPSLKSRWRREGSGCVVTLPTAARSDTPALVLRLALEG